MLVIVTLKAIKMEILARVRRSVLMTEAYIRGEKLDADFRVCGGIAVLFDD